MKVGFIGLGVMGRPMALNVLRRGFEVGVYARSDTAGSLVSAGAASYGSPAALAEVSDVIVTMVTGTSDVEEVLLGPRGIVRTARPGAIAIDMSTIAPRATARMAAELARHGIQMLDAPVSGGPAGAENATLTIMVGGDAEVLGRVRPILDCLGTTVVHMGGHGAGQTAKACNQLALLVTTQGVAEALALASRCGLDPRAVRRALLSGLAASRVLDLFGGRMAERQFQPGIEARLYHKDLHIVLETAESVGQPLPAATVVMESVDALIGAGKGRMDLSSLIELLEPPFTGTK